MELNSKQLKALASLQESIDEMLEQPTIEQYVHQAKLSLLDDRYKMVDELLKAGYLKGMKDCFKLF